VNVTQSVHPNSLSAIESQSHNYSHLDLSSRFKDLFTESVARTQSTATTANTLGPVTTKRTETALSTSTLQDASKDDTLTAETVFGDNVWLTAPSGSSDSGSSYSFNPTYFATKETAEKVAQMLGGTVVVANAMVGDTGPFHQSVPNYMVELANGHHVNAGLTATYFTHGWSQSQIEQMLSYDREV